MKRLFKKRAKFVCIIGEDGAVLTYIEGKRMVSRLFASSASNHDRKEFDALFAKYPKVPLYVLLDSVEQSYTKQVLPAVSPLSIGKLVKKRLERDFSETDIKGAIQIGRVESGRKDWLYMFAALPMTESINAWLEYLTALPQIFMGIYMLPIEMERFAQSLGQIIFAPDKVAKPADWQFLITHNKTGGFRQIVLHKKQIIFTRMIRPGKETMPDVIAGNIEQEILNTIDYLRRLSFGDAEGIDVIVVVSKEIKHGLRDVKIRSQNIIALTPSEVCSYLNYEDVSSENDKFADLLLAAHFANAKSILRLFTPQTKKVYNLSQAYFGVGVAFVVIVPLIGLYALMSIVNIIQMNSQVKKAILDKASIERQWNGAQKMDNYNIDDTYKVTSAVRLYNQLSTISEDPLTIVKNLYEAQQSYAWVSSFNWRYQPPLPNKAVSTSAKDSKKDKGLLVVSVAMKFYNMGTGVEQLFQNFDQFTRMLKQNFSAYQLDHTKLPDKISLKDRKEELDIQLTIKSK